MIRVSKKDYLDLRDKHAARFGGLFEEIQKTAKVHEDTVTFDETSLPAAFESMVKSWLTSARVYFKQTFEIDDALARQQKVAREQAELNDQATVQAAQARMQHYLTEEGLLESNENLALMTRWFDTNHASFTAHNVDLAIAALSGQLHWTVWSPRLRKAKVEEVASTPEQPYIKSLSREQIVERLGDRDKRERLIERVLADRKKRGERFNQRADALSEVTARLNESEPQEVPVQ